MSTGSLESTQRALWRLITAPEGVEEALRSSGEEGRALAALVRDDRGVDAVARLGVYANAYFARLRDCLEQDYGALAKLLGEAAFHDLVKLYLLAHPPRHPSLRFAGDRLHRFLARSAAAELFRSRWPCASDLAALEWALVDAFDAPDAPTLQRDALAEVPPDDWEGLRFEPVPALAVLSLAWPVAAVRERFDAGLELPAELSPAPERVRVWRRDERVHHQAVDPLEADALELLRSGGSFGEMCLRVAEQIGDADTGPRTAAFLETWLADGLFTSLRLT